MKKPASIVYGLEDTPPAHVTVLNGVQFVALIAINLVYPLLVFRVAGASADLVGSMLAVGMLVLAAGTFLQAWRTGSGYMCPATFTATYLGPSLLAAQVGGLPLVFGMTLFAGILEMVIAPLLNRLRPIFPPEVSGLVIFVIGLSGGLAGLRAMLGDNAPPVSGTEWWIAAFTLGAMVGFNVWGTGIARMLCALIGVVLGYAAAGFAGLVTDDQLRTLADASWVGLPGFTDLSWSLSFNSSMMVPFAIAAIAAAMKAVGTIAVCQRTNDAQWVRPEMRSITRGVLADGASTALAGAMGALGTNTSTPAVGLAAATGVTSRRVAYAIGVLFIIVGLFPKLTALLAVMPRPLIVASLLFAVTFIMINGLQVMSSRMLDARRTLVVGLAIVAGMAVEVFPALAAGASAAAKPLIGSSLVFATVVALALNFLFRLGVRQTATLQVEHGTVEGDTLDRFMATNGAAWGAQRDVVERAKFNLAQSLEVVLDSCEPKGPVLVAATFDEFNLDVRVSYEGPAIELPEQRPTNDEIMASAEGERRLAGFMLRRHADRVAASHKDGRSTILFHFDH
jgi:xanthine permease XanP